MDFKISGACLCVNINIYATYIDIIYIYIHVCMYIRYINIHIHIHMISYMYIMHIYIYMPVPPKTAPTKTEFSAKTGHSPTTNDLNGFLGQNGAVNLHLKKTTRGLEARTLKAKMLDPSLHPWKINGGFTWEYGPPGRWLKIIWTKASFSGATC